MPNSEKALVKLIFLTPTMIKKWTQETE